MNTGECFQLSFFRVSLYAIQNSWSMDPHLKAHPISDLFPQSIGMACVKTPTITGDKGRH